MALVIRLRQQGAKNRQVYRLVVTDEKERRDGKYLEKLGSYNPYLPNEINLQINSPRIQYWLDMGAKISDRANSLIKRVDPVVANQRSARRLAKKLEMRTRQKN